MAERLDGNRLLLTIEDSSAKYPITVDPWVQLAKLISSDPASLQFRPGNSDKRKYRCRRCTLCHSWDQSISGCSLCFREAAKRLDKHDADCNADCIEWRDSDNFGLSVAINKNTIVVGATGHGIGTGAAYVFVKPESGWGDMTQTASLTGSGVGDFLGMSVGVSGDTVVVTSTVTGNHGEGPASPTFMSSRLVAGPMQSDSDAESFGRESRVNFFGYSCSISGDTVVVGSPSDLTSGAAYVFVKPKTGWPQNDD